MSWNKGRSDCIQIMPTVKVGAPNHALSLVRYSYPIVLELDDGDQVILDRFYSDFLSLYSSLVSKSGKQNVPSLPPREWDTTSRVRERRRASFQYFLNWCIMNASNDQSVAEFFGIKSLTGSSVVPITNENVGAISADEQTVVKFLFFAFLWLLAWRAMMSTTESEPADNAPEWQTAVFNDSFQHVDLVLVQKLSISGKDENVDANTALVESTLDVIRVESGILAVYPAGDEVDETGAERTAQDARLTEDSVDDTPVQESPKEEIVPEALEPVLLDPVDVKNEIPLTSENSAMVEVEKETSSPNEIASVSQSSDQARSVENEFETYLRLESSSTEETLGSADPSKKKEVEFFFTPLHGLVGFVALYVVVLAWSNMFPSAVDGPEEVEFPNLTHSEHAGSSKIDEDATSSSHDINEEPETITMQEARVLFDRLISEPELDSRVSSLGWALLLRATGEQRRGVQVLSRFWDEASALSSEEAQARFISFVLSRYPTPQSRNRALEFPQHVVDSADEESSIASNNSAMAIFNKPQLTQSSSSPEDSPKSLGSSKHGSVKWWDSQPEERSQISPLKQVDGSSVITSFDSTDVSSLSISPSPVRAPPGQSREGKISALPHTALRLDIEEIALKKVEKENEIANVALGAIIGFGSAALVTSLVRGVARSRWF